MIRIVNRVFARILLLAIVAMGCLAAIGGYVIYAGGNNLYEQKQNDIRHIVEAALSIIADLDKRATAGEMTRADAQAQAVKTLTPLRYGHNDYLFIYDPAGKVVLNAVKPELNGTNRFDEKDPKGRYYIRDFIRAGQSGGGTVLYGYQRPQSTEYAGDKLSYIGGYQPWGWNVGSGVLLEDVHAMESDMQRGMLLCLGGAAVLLLLAVFLVTRSIVGPLGRLRASLDRLAAGDIDAEVEGVRRGDEFGMIARAVLKLRDVVRGRMQEQMAREQDSKTASEAERRRALGEVATALNQQVRSVVDTVQGAAQELLTTAHSMESEAQSARRETASAAQVSGRAAEHVAAVGEAAGQLEGAIGEISARAVESSKISQDAVTQIREAGTIVRTLSEASAEIGKVVSLIQAIAEQTNLLALNATIEAARAGEAGKGFAVVASEVKQLASQTSKATEEISGRIGAVVGATDKAAQAIDGVDRTISHIDEIASAIAAAVEEQGAATAQITGAVARTMQETKALSASLESLSRAADNTNVSSQAVVKSASGLSGHAKDLTREVEQFVARVANA